jgi:predicted transcriptional regulator of viral defense system
MPDPIDTRTRRRSGGRLGATLLAELDRRHITVLRVPDDWPLVDEVTGSRSASRSLIFRLSESQLLRKIKRGAYAVRPRSGTLALSALDLVGGVGPESHMVTAGRALAHHGLTDQSYRTIIVLVPSAQRGWVWQGETVRYIPQAEDRIWGARELRAARRPTMIARPERAILDSLVHPSWGVSLSQSVGAIALALRRDATFADRLARATSRYGNAAQARRIGFTVDRVAGERAASPFRSLIGTSRSTTPLDPRGPRAGPIHSEWRLHENVPFELLLEEQAT